MALDIVLVRQGEKFQPEYVNLFKRFNPLTLTDRTSTPGRVRPLVYPWQGWWAKMELFSPENEDIRPCLYFDLDTYILGNIGDMLEPFEGLGMLRDFHFPDRPASGVMFVPEDTSRIWDKWIGRPEHWMDAHKPGSNRVFGDQAFLGQFCDWFIQDRFDGIVSYKRHAREEPTGRICCFHGQPKPHEAKGWAKNIWQTCKN